MYILKTICTFSKHTLSSENKVQIFDMDISVEKVFEFIADIVDGVGRVADELGVNTAHCI